MKKGTLATWVERNGEEVDVVVGWCAYSPEPDTNYPGGVEVDYVALPETDKDITDELSWEAYNALRERVERELNERAEDDGYGDWLHDCRRDDKLTGDA